MMLSLNGPFQALKEAKDNRMMKKWWELFRIFCACLDIGTYLTDRNSELLFNLQFPEYNWYEVINTWIQKI